MMAQVLQRLSQCLQVCLRLCQGTADAPFHAPKPSPQPYVTKLFPHHKCRHSFPTITLDYKQAGQSASIKYC